MIILKISAFCVFLCAGWVIGAVVSNGKTARKNTVWSVLLLVHFLQEEISLRHSNLKDLYEKVSKNEKFQTFVFEKDGCFQTLSPPNNLIKSEVELYKECFSRLGTANAQEEQKRLEYFAVKFDEVFKEISAEEKSAILLNQKLGIAFGAMLALVLI